MAFDGKEFSWRNFWVSFAVALGAFGFAFPFSLIGSTFALPSFLIYMKLLDVTTVPPSLASNFDALLGAISGVSQVGSFINVFIVSWISDKYGRKKALHWSGLLSLLGGALSCGSRNVTMFIVSRLFVGAGSWGYLVVTPAYCAELAPPALRGLMVGMFGAFISLGYLLGTVTGLGFYFTDGNTQWRGPFGLSLFFPILISGLMFFVPESPRYLLMQERVDEAREIVLSLHTVHGDKDQSFARSEFYQMSRQAQIDRSLAPTYLDMFRKPSYRKRTLMAMMVAFIGQSTGILVLNSYGPTIYGALGYDTLYQLIFNMGTLCVGLLGTIIGTAVVDRIGRRALLVVGPAGCCMSLILLAAMVASFAGEATNKAGLRMGVAATYIFLFFYSVGVDVGGYVFYSELFPTHLRTKGLAIVIATIALADLVYLEATATAFRNIGWKFYLLFIIISGLGAIATYFVLPETKGIPLEEIAKLFGDEVAVYSANVHVDSNTHQLVVEDENMQRVATEGGEKGNSVVKHENVVAINPSETSSN